MDFDITQPQVLVNNENLVCMHMPTQSMIDIWLDKVLMRATITRIQLTETAMKEMIDHNMMALVVEKLKEIGFKHIATANYGPDPARRKAYLRMHGFRRKMISSVGEVHELDLSKEYNKPTTATIVVTHAPSKLPPAETWEREGWELLGDVPTLKVGDTALGRSKLYVKPAEPDERG